MMGSVGFGELLVIGIIALIVFGPHRLPELAHRLGELLSKARSATKEFVDAVDSEYGQDVAPLKSLKDEYDATTREMTDAVSRLTDMQPSDDEPPSPDPNSAGDPTPSDEVDRDD